MAATVALVSSAGAATTVTLLARPGPVSASLIGVSSVEQVASRVVPSVVQLRTSVGRLSGEGSGVILTADGLILTNNHVVSVRGSDASSGATQLRSVILFDGRRAPYQIVGTDPTSDLAVVQAIGVSGLTPLPIGSSTNLRVGQQVVAVGSPLGLVGTVTSGIVSALNRPVSSVGDGANQNTVLDAIQTDAAINPGNSGGALVDMRGALVGINTAIATVGAPGQGSGGSIGLGFAIPVEQAKRIADQLISTGTATRATLGVRVNLAAGGAGAQIVEVFGGGPAARAGLPVGAVVTRLNDRIISRADALIAAVRSRVPGETISLRFTDPSGADRRLEVTLGSS